ncbi:hypothetical protein HKD37_03G006596 [Glycine soja]
MDFSISIDLAPTERSSDLLAFLNQLLEKVGENVAALMVVTAFETGTLQEVSRWPKKHQC